MRHRKITVAAALLSVTLLMSACSRVTNGRPSAQALTGASLATILINGNKTVTSAHTEMTIEAGPVSVTASGDQTQRKSVLTALDMTETVPSVGTLRMIVIGDALYLKLPDSINPTDKPWVRISQQTTDPALTPYVSVLQLLRYEANMDRYALFARATDQVQNRGQQAIAGTPTTHYSLSVRVDRLPPDFPDLGALKSADITAVPVDVWADRHGRTVKVAEHLAVGGQQSSTEVLMSRFNTKVTISAPPSAQVATR